MTEKHFPIHQTLDQARAKAAWALVSHAKESMKEGFDKYETLVKRFPALVNHNGLGQSVAFLFSKQKAGNVEGLLLAHLGKWLMQSDLNRDIPCYARPYDDAYEAANTDEDPLMDCIMRHDSRKYIHATREALAFLDYLRRFADGINT